jgi:hypothetical protein
MGRGHGSNESDQDAGCKQPNDHARPNLTLLGAPQKIDDFFAHGAKCSFDNRRKPTIRLALMNIGVNR